MTYFQRLNKIIKVIAVIKRNCSSISQLDGNEPAIPVVELAQIVFILPEIILLSHILVLLSLIPFPLNSNLHFTYIFLKTYVHPYVWN